MALLVLRNAKQFWHNHRMLQTSKEPNGLLAPRLEIGRINHRLQTVMGLAENPHVDRPIQHRGMHNIPNRLNQSNGKTHFEGREDQQ